MQLCQNKSILLRKSIQSSPTRGLRSAPINSRFKILFMGRDEFSCTVLNQLHSAKDVWETISIATHPDERVGRRGSVLSVSPLKLLGESLDIPIHTIPHTKPEFKQWKLPEPFYPQPFHPPNDHLLVTASFGRILPKTMLDLFLPSRRLNVHPSLLPAYRGPAPIQHTILNNEKDTGVCIIEMLKKKEGIDAGELWGQSKVSVPEDVTFKSLRDTLAEEGGKLLVSVLREMQAGKAESIPQSSDKIPSSAPMITIEDSIVNFNTMTANEIVTRHHAISHQRPLMTHIPNYHNKTLQLHEPSVSSSPSISSTPGTAKFDKPTKLLLIQCADNSVLSVPRLKQEGKALIPAGDWWNGAKGLGLVEERIIILA